MSSRLTLTVSQLNEYIRRMLQLDPMLHGVELKGEISNLKFHQTGTIFFTLKDELSAISCVMYASDVLIDQLYSYTPATNALLAMSKGIVAVSGAEPEYYDFIGEHALQPIVNVLPDPAHIYNTLEELILHRERIPQQCRDSRTFVEQHHDYRKVAQQFIDFWSK